MRYPFFLVISCHWKQAAPKVFLWSAGDPEPQTPMLGAASHRGNSLTGGEALPVWSLRGPTPLSCVHPPKAFCKLCPTQHFYSSKVPEWCFSSPGCNGKYFSSRPFGTFRAPAQFFAGNV